MELRGLNEWQAFSAMMQFLSEYWERNGRPGDLSVLLSSIGRATPGTTADPAIWHDWARAVGTVIADNTASEIPIHPGTGIPVDLILSIAEWCSRPGMYLVGDAPQEVRVSMLLAHIHGFLTAWPSPVYSRFREWVFERRPDFRNSSAWYGANLLKEFNGDHNRTLEVILEWVREFRSSEQLA